MSEKSRVRVKVCGMREPEQVSEIVRLGVDAIGMIFYSKSARNISVEQALKVREVVPVFVDLVGVFVDTPVEEINQIANTVGLDLVQLHGKQDADFAAQLNVPYIRAIRVENQNTIKAEMSEHNKARGFLFDTFSEKAYGGTGHRIEQDLLQSVDMSKCILAGGIRPSNISEILAFKPYAIDINSGVEISPANKDIEKVKKIMSAL